MFKNFDKNTIIGALLIITMVMFYFNYSKNQMEKKVESEKLQKALRAKDIVSQAKVSTVNALESANGIKNDSSQFATASLSIPGQDLILSNELISLKVNTKGAKIHSAQLKKQTSYE